MIALGLVATGWAAWPTFGHDARRTGQADVSGPAEVLDAIEVPLADGLAVNMPAVVGPDGVAYVGTWGVIRSGGSEDRSTWDKLDGQLYALDADGSARWTFTPDPVPYCYAYDGRSDPDNCPDGGAWNYYNGTVEGTPALVDGVLYVGRGDGKLYAIDAETGERVWTFTTFNPEDPDDPEGGGEIIGGPVVDGDGVIYFGTVAAGEHETNAIYAVHPDGRLRWRYPADAASLDAIIEAPPALSPDGATVYVASAFGPTVDRFDPTVGGTLYAFDTSADGEAVLRWSVSPINAGEWWAPVVWITRLAVGSDGTIYAGGGEYTLGGGSAVVYAWDEDGGAAWDSYADVDRDEAAFVLGLALREEDGATTAVLATSTNLYSFGYPDGGALVALDPGSGDLQWSFDPAAHGLSGGMTGLSVDADGRIYTGTSGATDGGTVVALDADGGLRWTYALDGLLEWSHPVLAGDGRLVVADTQRCLSMIWPVETASCDDAVGPPQVVILSGDPAPKPEPGCGCAATGAPAWTGLLAIAALIAQRRTVRPSTTQVQPSTAP